MDFINISSREDFDRQALETFRFQARENLVYAKWLRLLGINPLRISSLEEIPCLPVEFFKNHEVACGNQPAEMVFTSSGTTGSIPSRHPVKSLAWYQASLTRGFEIFFGSPKQYTILALLPSYLERSGSSLVYMVDHLIRLSGHPLSGFYLHNLGELADMLTMLEKSGTPVLLFGVTYALLDLAEQFPIKLKNTRIIETGGMKGQREELTRNELHQILKEAFSLPHILSEYGMTELLSQAWSMGNQQFNTPPWMKIRISDPYNPLAEMPADRTGTISVIDLANRFSCSFIQTQDLGRIHPDGSFEVIGRFDHSELRGCNLMIG